MSKSDLSIKKPNFLNSLTDPSQVKTTWGFFQKIPFGKWIFSKVMGWIIPYTGKMSAYVQKIEPGYAVVQLQERRKIRNHLNSVHAIALANVGEFCCGLALFSRSPPQTQAILVKLSCTYIKKARGLLTASTHFEVKDFESNKDYSLTAEIKNSNQELVGLVDTTWRIRIQ